MTTIGSMPNNKSNLKQLQVEFGRFVAAQFDREVSEYRESGFTPNAAEVSRWKRYCSNIGDEKEIEARRVQRVLEGFIHGLLCRFDDGLNFRIQIKDQSGNWHNLQDTSAEGLQSDLFTWLEEFSKYGSVTMQLVALDLP